MNRISIFAFISIGILFTSCRNDLETAQWDVDLLAPIIVTDLDLGDIVGDSNLVVGSDSSLSLVYRTELANYGLKDLIEPFNYTHYEYLSLDSLELPDIIVPSSISLGQIAQASGFIGQLIIANNGNTMVIPDLGSIPGTSTPIDASQYFESISLVDGTLEITIENGLPIAVEDFGFGILNNNAAMDVLIQDTLDYIAPGATATSTSSLAGKTIESNLLAELYGMSSPGSDGQSVLIDTSNALIITLTIKDLSPFSATTIWPAQNIINDTSEVVLGGTEDMELTFGTIRSGNIVTNIYSTITDSIQFEYEIPESDLNGQPFRFIEALPAAPPGGIASVNNIYDFSGIDLNLTGRNHDKFNTLYHIILGRIDSTGLIATLSLDDSVTVELLMQDLIIDYARGDFGTDSLEIGPEITYLNGLENIVSGSISLDKARATLEIYNPIGAGAQFNLNQITGYNTRTNEQVSLDLSSSGQSITVFPASESNGVISPETGSLSLNETNSNVDAFLSNLPDRIEFSGSVYMNPNGHHIGFMYYDHPLRAYLDLEVPVHLGTNEITLVDTSKFSIGEAPEWNNVLGGQIKLLVDNGMPFEAQITLDLLAADGSILESIFVENTVQAPALNADLIVVTQERTELLIPLTDERINNFKLADQARFEVVFNTASHPEKVKFYSTYSINIKMVGDLTYRLNN